MEKYIPVPKLSSGKQDLNKVAELMEAGKCFVKDINDTNIFHKVLERVIYIDVDYYKLDKE